LAFAFNHKKQAFSIYLDDKVFEDIHLFKDYVKKLPQNSIIEWHHDDGIFTHVKEPIGMEDPRGPLSATTP
jgi:hypothetical protein